MTGRARGRSRGRGRTDAPAGGEARRPGESAVRPPDQAQVGRGRSRGPPTDAVQQRQPPQQAAQPPTAAMGAMTVQDSGAARGQEPQQPQRRGGRFNEPVTRPEGFDKKGNSGQQINLITNSFLLETRPNFTIYQYNVFFNPEIDYKKARIGLVGAQSELLGDVRAFDGQILFLPIKLADEETRIQTVRRRREGEGDPVEIKICLTNELPQDSPMMMQIFNIIFRRYMQLMIPVHFLMWYTCF